MSEKWKMVPFVMTDEMTEAARAALDLGEGYVETSCLDLDAAYEAAICAAPTYPQQDRISAIISRALLEGCDNHLDRAALAKETARQVMENVPASESRAERLMHAMEGELDGHTCDVEAAMRILAHVDASADGAQTAPVQAVKVKPLKWTPFRAETPWGYYNIDDQTDRSAAELSGRAPFLLSGSRVDNSRFNSLEAARAAAQSDYEHRILSALVAAPSYADGIREGLRRALEAVRGCEISIPLAIGAPDGWSMTLRQIEAAILSLLTKEEENDKPN